MNMSGMDDKVEFYLLFVTKLLLLDYSGTLR